MKNRHILICIFLLFFPQKIFSSDETFLKLDTKGHMGLIRDILVTNDKKYLISCSEDKSVRIWNIQTGREAAKILGEIGPGHQGKIFAAALSPDDKYLAVGGYLNSCGGSDYGNIRIYDFRSRQLVQVLKSHKNSVLDLNFDSSGNYLVSGSFDKTIKIWKKEKKGFGLYKTFSNHLNAVYAVNFLKRSNSNLIVSGGYDKRINLYDLEKGKIRTYLSSHKIQSIAVSDRFIAACGTGKEIIVLDCRLKEAARIKLKTVPKALAFSRNGKYLVSGSGKSPFNCNIYNADFSFKKINTFKKHKNTVAAVNFADSNIAVTGGGKNKEIYMWNIFTGKIRSEISGKGNIIWSVGINGNQIAFGTKYNVEKDHYKKQSSLEKIIDLGNFTINEENYFKDFVPIKKNFKNYFLSHSKGGVYMKPNGILNIFENNKKVSQIIRGSQNGYGHYCYGFTDKGIIISGGNGGNLKAYLKDGTETADFVGHTGTVWSIAVQGDVLVSGSSDQTIKLWNLKEIETFGLKPEKIYPFLNIFVSNDNEWVIWSRSGYYNSSIGGDEFVGFHVNKGAYKEGEFYLADRFFKTYYKPNLIKKIIALKSEDSALKYAENKQKIVVKESGKILPPKIILNTDPEIETDIEKVLVDFYVDSNSDNKITAIRIFVNGRELVERGLKNKRDKNSLIRVVREIELTQKKNIIKIIAENKYSVSNPVYINVKYREKKIQNIFKPVLYILSVGVSDYKNPDLNLDYAAEDALSIVELFKKQKNIIYRDVKYKLMKNREATRLNILKGLLWLKRESTQKDVVLIFIAGHGINDEFDNYFFLPHDADRNFLSGTSVKWSGFDDVVKNIPSKVILMADACHSGNIAGGKRRSADITGALKELISAGTGQVIMTATTGGAAAFENSSWGHGAFTKAVNDGLGLGYADYDNDKIITIKELDFYVTFRVKELTDGRQKPTTIVPSSIPDFPIAVSQPYCPAN